SHGDLGDAAQIHRHKRRLDLLPELVPVHRSTCGHIHGDEGALRSRTLCRGVTPHDVANLVWIVLAVDTARGPDVKVHRRLPAFLSVRGYFGRSCKRRTEYLLLVVLVLDISLGLEHLLLVV